MKNITTKLRDGVCGKVRVKIHCQSFNGVSSHVWVRVEVQIENQIKNQVRRQIWEEIES